MKNKGNGKVAYSKINQKTISIILINLLITLIEIVSIGCTNCKRTQLIDLDCIQLSDSDTIILNEYDSIFNVSMEHAINVYIKYIDSLNFTIPLEKKFQFSISILRMEMIIF